MDRISATRTARIVPDNAREEGTDTLRVLIRHLGKAQLKLFVKQEACFLLMHQIPGASS